MVRLVATLGAAGGVVAAMLPGGAVRPERPDAGVVAGAAALVLVAALTYVRPKAVVAESLSDGDPADDELSDDDPADDESADGEPADDDADLDPDVSGDDGEDVAGEGDPGRQWPWQVRLITGLLAVGAAGWAVYSLLMDIASGLPGRSTALLAVAGSVVLVGVLADAFRPGTVRLFFASVLVVVLVAAGVTGAFLAPRLPVRANRAAAVEPASIATAPGERRWTWSSTNDLRDIVVAGAGVVVAVDGGEVVALDGPAGTVRWRYARSGAHVRALVSTPDRAAVVVALAPGGGRVTGSALLVVLDAVTGAVLRESAMDDSLADADFLVPTNTVLPVRESRGTDDDIIRGIDLRSGAQLWTWSAPAGCTSPFHLARSGADVVFTSVRCGQRVGVVALDERSGEQRWDLTTATDTATDTRVDYFLDTSPDGRIASLRIGGTGVNVLLRSADGTVLTTVDRPAQVDVGTHPLFTGAPGDELGPEIVDPLTGRRTELPGITCDAPRAEATTASAYLRICGPDVEAVLVWQDYGGDGEVTRTPIGWGASAPALMLGSGVHAVVLPAPGAIVVARAGDNVVTGYPA